MTVEVRKAVALAGLLGVWLALAGAAPVDEDIPAATVRLRVEQDWLRQGEAWAEAEWSGRRVPVSTAADAAGAVDGVKNGKYAFHTANAPYHDGFINMRPEHPPYDLAADNALLGKLQDIHGRRCAACHQAAAVSRLDWIDLARPDRSRLLTAPLARDAGGTAKCGQPSYADQRDADYQALRQLVQDAVRKAWERPRRDLASLRASNPPK